MEHCLRESFLLVLVISCVPMLASCATGLVVAVLQAATQISEQSIGFLARFLSMSAVLAFTFNSFSAQLVRFLQEMVGGLALIGRMP